jgi:hypothetical protein
MYGWACSCVRGGSDGGGGACVAEAGTAADAADGPRDPRSVLGTGWVAHGPCRPFTHARAHVCVLRCKLIGSAGAHELGRRWGQACWSGGWWPSRTASGSTRTHAPAFGATCGPTRSHPAGAASLGPSGKSVLQTRLYRQSRFTLAPTALRTVASSTRRRGCARASCRSRPCKRADGQGGGGGSVPATGTQFCPARRHVRWIAGRQGRAGRHATHAEQGHAATRCARRGRH